MPPKRVAKRQASPPSSSDERPASRAATPWPEPDTTVYQKAQPAPLAGASAASRGRRLGELKSYGLPKLNVPVSTIQRFRNEYRAALKQQYKDGNVRPVLLERRAPGRRRPRGLALAKLKDWLKAYLDRMRGDGAVIRGKTIIGAAKGILMKKRRRYDLLELSLVNRHWLQSFKDRHGSGLAGPTKYFPPTKMTKIAKY
eukprot:tig00000158_g10194.t1